MDLLCRREERKAADRSVKTLFKKQPELESCCAVIGSQFGASYQSLEDAFAAFPVRHIDVVDSS